MVGDFVTKNPNELEMEPSCPDKMIRSDSNSAADSMKMFISLD